MRRPTTDSSKTAREALKDIEPSNSFFNFALFKFVGFGIGYTGVVGGASVVIWLPLIAISFTINTKGGGKDEHKQDI